MNKKLKKNRGKAKEKRTLITTKLMPLFVRVPETFQNLIFSNMLLKDKAFLTMADQLEILPLLKRTRHKNIGYLLSNKYMQLLSFKSNCEKARHQL